MNIEQRFTYLTDLELGVHEKHTRDDQEAIDIVRQLIDELRPGTPLKVVSITYESERYPLPFLRASRAVFYGIQQIRGLAKQERLLAR